MPRSHEPVQPAGSAGTAPTRPIEGGSLAPAAASFLLTGALLAVIVSTQGRFNRIFTDFQTKMPALTEFVGSASFAWLAGILFGLTTAKELLLKSRKARATCNTAAIVAALYAAGMIGPLIGPVNLRS